MLVQLFGQACLFFVAVHVSHQAVTSAPPLAWPMPAAVATATGALALELEAGHRAAASAGFLLAPVALAGVFRAADVLDTFALAFTVGSFYVFFVRAAHEMGIALYAANTDRFLLTRVASYGLLRGTVAVLEEHCALPTHLARLAPAAVATCESVGMAAYGIEGTYAFPVRSRRFFVYATVKLCAFVALPLYEDALLGKVSAR